MFYVISLHSTNMLSDCCLKHIIENSSSICHVYTAIRYTQPQFPIYVYMLIHPQRWSTRRAIIWQEILRFVSSSVRSGREVLSISKYRYYIALWALCYVHKSRLLFAYFLCIVTNSNLALSSMLAPPEHIAHLETLFVNILVEFRESAVRVMEYVLSIHLTIM